MFVRGLMSRITISNFFPRSLIISTFFKNDDLLKCLTQEGRWRGRRRRRGGGWGDVHRPSSPTRDDLKEQGQLLWVLGNGQSGGHHLGDQYGAKEVKKDEQMEEEKLNSDARYPIVVFNPNALSKPTQNPAGCRCLIINIYSHLWCL